MSKTEIGTHYERWGEGDDFEALPGARMIAEIDESEPYEVDQTRIYVAAGGTFVLATASGCSCWEGDWELTRYDTLAELIDDIGPLGGSEHDYNPSFKGAEALAKQALEWKLKN